MVESSSILERVRRGYTSMDTLSWWRDVVTRDILTLTSECWSYMCDTTSPRSLVQFIHAATVLCDRIQLHNAKPVLLQSPPLVGG